MDTALNIIQKKDQCLDFTFKIKKNHNFSYLT